MFDFAGKPAFEKFSRAQIWSPEPFPSSEVVADSSPPPFIEQSPSTKALRKVEQLKEKIAAFVAEPYSKKAFRSALRLAKSISSAGAVSAAEEAYEESPEEALSLLVEACSRHIFLPHNTYLALSKNGGKNFVLAEAEIDPSSWYRHANGSSPGFWSAVVPQFNAPIEKSSFVYPEVVIIHEAKVHAQIERELHHLSTPEHAHSLPLSFDFLRMHSQETHLAQLISSLGTDSLRFQFEQVLIDRKLAAEFQPEASSLAQALLCPDNPRFIRMNNDGHEWSNTDRYEKGLALYSGVLGGTYRHMAFLQEQGEEPLAHLVFLSLLGRMHLSSPPESFSREKNNSENRDYSSPSAPYEFVPLFFSETACALGLLDEAEILSHAGYGSEALPSITQALSLLEELYQEEFRWRIL